jgi:hypothetical protein
MWEVSLCGKTVGWYTHQGYCVPEYHKIVEKWSTRCGTLCDVIGGSNDEEGAGERKKLFTQKYVHGHVKFAEVVVFKKVIHT